MGQVPEELSTTPDDIEATRAQLSRNIDELGDKVSPGRVMERRKEAVKGRLGSLRSSVMGSASDARDRVGSAGGSVGGTASEAAGTLTDTAQSAVGSVQARTEGNPLAAGLIAFGAGMLVAALVPASEKEAQAAQRVVETAKDKGQPLLDEAKSAGQEMGQTLKEQATEAVQEVRSTAQDSVQTVKDEGQSSAQTVKEQAKPS